jgi:ribonuclease D
MWIDTDKTFIEFCGRAETSPVLAVDLEFQGEGRYYSLLCLVQLGIAGEFVAVDPFKVNLAPLAPLLESEAIRKLFHAGNQDIAILKREVGVVPRNVFDTQIAAAFLGYGESLGYVPLVQRITKVPLDKKHRFTDWTRRPLSREQIDYALNDVRYLLPVYEAIVQRLDQRGRKNWVVEASAEMTEQSAKTREIGKEYLRLGKLSGFSRRELGVLRELAMWREEVARERNRPVGSVMNDDALRQICYTMPKNETVLKNIRGIGSLSKENVTGILDAVKRGLAIPDAELPELVTSRETDPSMEGIASLLSAVVRSRAIALEIAPNLLANRDDLNRFASWILAGCPADVSPGSQTLDGWRRDAVGEILLNIGLGKASLKVDPNVPGGIVIVEEK